MNITRSPFFSENFEHIRLKVCCFRQNHSTPSGSRDCCQATNFSSYNQNFPKKKEVLLYYNL
jgi:hypothetical protein